MNLKNIPDLALCACCKTVNKRRTECVECGNWVGEGAAGATFTQLGDWLDKNPIVTPKPWSVGWHGRGHGHGDYGILDAEGGVVADVKTGLVEDALVLAAAPALLETLQELVKAVEAGNKKINLDQAKAALEAATEVPDA